MILFIGGESHTGKTLLMQALIERYHMPACSLDHIKMGLFRGKAFPFVPQNRRTDRVRPLSQKLSR